MIARIAVLTLLSLLRPSARHLRSTADAFVMDGHIHVMTRELLQGLDIGHRYPDGHFDLVRAQAGDWMPCSFPSIHPNLTIPAGTR